MPELLTQDYPFFKAGLPLRSKDLNGLVQYLESEDRITRVCLIGAGIMYGFKINLENALDPSRSVVKITKGTGITSLGYVFCLDADLRGEANKDITLDKSEFSDEAAQVLFNEIVTEQRLKSAQVLTDIDVAAGILKENLINKYVLLFYRLSGDESRSGCANCEKGIVTEAHILLITLNQTDYTTLIQQGCPTPPAGGTLQQAFPMMNRFLNAEITINETQFIDRYRAIANSALVEIKALFNTLNANAFLKELFNITLSVSRLDNLEKYINKLPPLPLPRNIQYAYSYLRDLIKAYIEYAETPFGQTVNFLPNSNCFPRHLVLGKIVKRDGEATLSIDYSERTPLYRPPFDDLRLDDLEHGRTLFGRLEDMLQQHFFDENADNVFDESRSDLRITPSHAVSTPLSKQAIPFYFNFGGVQGRWNYRLQRTGRTQFIPFYDANKTLMKQAPFDHADFYRIEGMVGKTLESIKFGVNNQGEITSQLHELRKELQLPFDIVFCLIHQASGRPLTQGINSLADYARMHPGLEHQGGVPKGGTFVVVMNNDNQIIGDFCLPYWIQPIVEPIVADFMTNQKGNVFMFDATPSSANTQNIRWSTNGGQIKDAVFAADKTYQPTLVLEQGETTKHFFIKLEAFSADGQKDVEITTVVITQRVALPDQVVAAISIIERKPLSNGETILFDSVDSKFAQEFEWFIDGKANVKTPKMTADFVFDNERQTSKSFLIKLLARNKESQREDVEEIVITINRAIQIPAPIARFNLINPQGSAATPEGTIVPFRATLLGNTYELHIPTTNHERLLFSLSFNNVSLNTAVRYEWNIFQVFNDINQIQYLDSPVTINDKSNFSTSIKSLIWNIIAQEQKFLKYRIQLTAVGVNGETNTLSVLISVVVDPPIIGVVNPGDAIPAVDVINVIDVNEENIPPFRRNIIDELAPAKSTVDPKEALKALRTRHRDYRKAIEQAATDTPELGKVKSYQSVVGFITGFQDDLARLDKQDAEFKKHALQFIQNIKRAGGIPDSAYQSVLKNMLFFYLDKLTHLLPNGLTAETDKTLKEVFSKMKSNNSFTPLSILQAEWHSEDIMTEQNAATVEQLKALFL